MCVCVCVYERDAWRISVPLQSSGCNQTGHWLHDVPKTPSTTHWGAPLSLFTLSCVFGRLSQNLGGMLGVKTIILAHITVPLFLSLPFFSE